MNLLATKSRPAVREEAARELAFMAARVAADHKAEDIVVLDMRKRSPLFDYFVLATATSRRQTHAIVEEIDDVLHREGEARLGIEGYESGRWVVEDYGDIVVHVFDPEARTFYALEDFWADCPKLDWE